MALPIYVVDSFTSEPFKGNPAGVCVLEYPLDETLMQKIATEMNHAETSFVTHVEGQNWTIRWFTPVCEADLCGHATLAAAHILWTTGIAQGDLCFDSRSGPLTATQSNGQIELDFPAEAAEEVAVTALLTDLAQGRPVWVGKNRMDYLLEVDEESFVRNYVPDYEQISRLDQRALILTAKADADKDYDFVSRLFAPNVGIPEDPVTGSAHCALAPYWKTRLGKNPLVGYQASPRGGYVGVEVQGDRVKLRGHAVTTLSGQLFV